MSKLLRGMTRNFYWSDSAKRQSAIGYNLCYGADAAYQVGTARQILARLFKEI